jgi:alpha-aminoadipate carrier protein LysW
LYCSDKFEAFKWFAGRLDGTMSEETITAEDPITGEAIEIPADVEVGEIIDSPITGAELEVVAVDPVALEEAPELEEDWGE